MESKVFSWESEVPFVFQGGRGGKFPSLVPVSLALMLGEASRRRFLIQSKGLNDLFRQDGLKLFVRSQEFWFSSSWNSKVCEGEKLRHRVGIVRLSRSTITVDTQLVLNNLIVASFRTVIVLVKNEKSAAIPKHHDIRGEIVDEILHLPAYSPPLSKTLGNFVGMDPDFSFDLKARRFDSDAYHHVNQSVYISWCLDALDEWVFGEYSDNARRDNLKALLSHSKTFHLYPWELVRMDYDGQVKPNQIVQIRLWVVAGHIPSFVYFEVSMKEEISFKAWSYFRNDHLSRSSKM